MHVQGQRCTAQLDRPPSAHPHSSCTARPLEAMRQRGKGASESQQPHYLDSDFQQLAGKPSARIGSLGCARRRNTALALSAHSISWWHLKHFNNYGVLSHRLILLFIALFSNHWPGVFWSDNACITQMSPRPWLFPLKNVLLVYFYKLNFKNLINITVCRYIIIFIPLFWLDYFDSKNSFQLIIRIQISALNTKQLLCALSL